jgi:hypothetical protein
MKIMIDIGHPAHAHMFKNFARILEKQGSEILFTVREKECCCRLLDDAGFTYRLIGGSYASLGGKVWGLLKFTAGIVKSALKFKPDIFLSHASMYNTYAARLLGKPNIVLDDTANFKEASFYAPFADTILSPACLKADFGNKHIKYNGYHELMYLRPEYFKPDISVLNELKVGSGDKFAIVRFSGHTPLHDLGYSGIPLSLKIKCVDELSKYAKVFISSEIKLPSRLDKYIIPLTAQKMHSAIYYAALVYSEGATMTSEAAILGAPAVYVDFKGRDYTRQQEIKYGSVFNFSDSSGDIERSIQNGVQILLDKDSKIKWRLKSDKLMADTIDVTKFLVWFVTHYPESFMICRRDPDFQLKFMAGPKT